MDSLNYPSCGMVFNALQKPVLRRLLLRMLHPNPAERLTIDGALNDRWVRSIECCCLDPEYLPRTLEYSDAMRTDSQIACQTTLKHNHFPPTKKGIFQALGI